MATSSSRPVRVDITKSSPLDWSYVSEGGATIVFSYSGPPNPDFTGTVLRLRKIENKPPPKEIYKPLDRAEGIDNASSEEDQTGDETSSSEDEDEPDDPTIAFQARITSNLIPMAHLPRLDPVKLKKHWLERLAKHGEHKRAPSRRAVDRIDVRKKKGVLATDLIGVNGWAVEIKPKWAFLPNPTHLSESTKTIKGAHCRFCMHTHQRSIKAPSTFVSQFCPLDLFSGDSDRIRKSLIALWDAWVGSSGSINNLKIFVHGNNILPSNVTGLRWLFGDLKVNGSPPEREAELLSSVLPSFIDAVLPVLLNTSIMSTLGRLQRTLDPLDIEGLSRLWETVPESRHAPIGVGSREVTLNEWEDFLQEYLLEMQKDPAALREEWTKPSADRLRYHLLAYLMSATFKDCSVILRFAPNQPPTITAIDLDPKSVERLAKWEKLDAEIVKCYKETGDSRKAPCVDAGRQWES